MKWYNAQYSEIAALRERLIYQNALRSRQRARGRYRAAQATSGAVQAIRKRLRGYRSNAARRTLIEIQGGWSTMGLGMHLVLLEDW